MKKWKQSTVAYLAGNISVVFNLFPSPSGTGNRSREEFSTTWPKERCLQIFEGKERKKERFFSFLLYSLISFNF